MFHPGPSDKFYYCDHEKSPWRCKDVPSTGCKAVLFTAFPDTEDEEPTYTENMDKQMTTAVWSKEICPETGKHHWQGYFVAKNCKKKEGWMGILKLFNNGKTVHEVAIRPSLAYRSQAKHDKAKNYCGAGDFEKDGKTKEANESYMEMKDDITFGQQGARTDLAAIKEQLLEGRSYNDIAELELSLEDIAKFGHAMETVENIARRKNKRDFQCHGVWFHGAEGTGKSHMAHWFMETFFKGEYFRVSDDVCAKGWWDAYNGESVIWWDEAKGEIEHKTLMSIVDKFPYDLPIRGKAPVPCLAKFFVVSSVASPESAYAKYLSTAVSGRLGELRRRFDVIDLGSTPMDQSASQELIDNWTLNTDTSKRTENADLGGGAMQVFVKKDTRDEQVEQEDNDMDAFVEEINQWQEEVLEEGRATPDYQTDFNKRKTDAEKFRTELEQEVKEEEELDSDYEERAYDSEPEDTVGQAMAEISEKPVRKMPPAGPKRKRIKPDLIPSFAPRVHGPAFSQQVAIGQTELEIIDLSD